MELSECVGYSVAVFSLLNLASLVPIVAEIVPPYSQRDLALSILEHFKVQFTKKHKQARKLLSSKLKYITCLEPLLCCILSGSGFEIKR